MPCHRPTLGHCHNSRVMRGPRVRSCSRMSDAPRRRRRRASHRSLQRNRTWQFYAAANSSATCGVRCCPLTAPSPSASPAGGAPCPSPFRSKPSQARSFREGRQAGPLLLRTIINPIRSPATPPTVLYSLIRISRGIAAKRPIRCMLARVRAATFVSESTEHNITFIVAYQLQISTSEAERRREGVFRALAASAPARARPR